MTSYLILICVNYWYLSKWVGQSKVINMGNNVHTHSYILHNNVSRDYLVICEAKRNS